MMDTLLADLRHAVRTLRKSPAFAIAVVSTLALAIGSNTAVTAITNHPILWHFVERLVVNAPGE